MSEPDNAAEPRKAGLPIAKLAAAAVVLIGLIALGSQAGSVLRQFTTWVDGLGFWAPLVFVAGYALAVASLIPGSILTLAGGAIFGLAGGRKYGKSLQTPALGMTTLGLPRRRLLTFTT